MVTPLPCHSGHFFFPIHDVIPYNTAVKRFLRPLNIKQPMIGTSGYEFPQSPGIIRLRAS